MMQKEAEPQNLEANAAKIEMNTQVAQLLHLDEDTLKAKSKELADAIKRASEGSPRILVAGGAGSGKTTIARILSTLFVVKNLDLDEYIPGGWTSDTMRDMQKRGLRRVGYHEHCRRYICSEDSETAQSSSTR